MRYRYPVAWSGCAGQIVPGSENENQVKFMVDRLFRVLVFFALLVAGTDVQAEVGNGPSRFLCFPFDSSSAGKYAYLADGIHSMLASRLAAKSGIQLVDYIGREAELKSL